MRTIYKHVANASGNLTALVPFINDAFMTAAEITEHELGAGQIDVIFIDAPSQAIPEYGIGGYAPTAHEIYVSLDHTSSHITKEYMTQTILHEVHHCMRWRDPGYGTTLGEAIVSEGMATLYESEHAVKPPLYALVDISDQVITTVRDILAANDRDNHSEWFYGGGKVARWFGYSYGYRLCERYAREKGVTAAKMVNLNATEILNFNHK